MKMRSLLLAALIVGSFVYLTTRADSPFHHVFSPGSSDAPLWSGPTVAESAGLGPDEQNNIDIYKNAKDSVAYITSTVIQRNFFFGDYQQRELGSGFLIDGEGRILTNYHVISGSAQVEVSLPSDHSNYKATILARDRVNDLALIKIEPKRKVTFLNLGDSDRLQVGQKVLAIGQPLALDGTLTVGVVSALHRDIQGENNNNLEGMIQTDAAINQGNSGGPLLDSSGNVIGINTAIYGPNGNIGIGFAMPINRAKTMLETIRSGKRVAPAQNLGAQGAMVSGDFAQALGLPPSGGLLVFEVYRGSAAASAGLRGAHDEKIVGNYRVPTGGDLVTMVDGKPVEDRDTIPRAIAKKRAGDTLDLTVVRDGKTMNVKVTLLEAQE
ncbi:MAG TPA: trypsin-like peptidase domain-containing protein [Bryobacteraceae bacterium]|jgi:S1-C subfamily serine protease